MRIKREMASDMAPIIAIVSKQRVTGPVNGSSAYLLALAETFKESGYAVHLIQPSPAIAGRTPILRMSPEMAVFESHVVRSSVRLGKLLLILDREVIALALIGMLKLILRRIGISGGWTQDRPRPHSIGTPWNEVELNYIARKVPDSTAIVVADYVFAAAALDIAPSHCEKAIIMHDLFHARKGGDLDSAARLDRAEELAALGHADVIITIQQDEHEFVERELPDVRAILAPMPAKPVSQSFPGDANRLLFVGSNTAPNTDGLAWFLKHIWPSIKQQRPDAVLDVVGSVCRSLPEHATSSDVIASGVVRDLRRHYAEAGVVISPLKFGSGLKIKLVEALAFGKATVVTPVTLQGVEDLCLDAVCVSNHAKDFAASVIRLQQDKVAREALAARALLCAKRYFSAESVHRDLRVWLTAQREKAV